MGRLEEDAMTFRWIVGITLWAMFIGPVFGPPAPAANDKAPPPRPAASRSFVP
jgi:hypothetical protein